MQELNPSQRAAVHYLDGPLLVLAGAGSGKTRVITEKIAHLLRRGGLRPEQLAAVTFTNKAAREMRQRVTRLTGAGEGRGLRISTFHTLGLGILRREGFRLGYRRGISILDQQDCLGMLAELLRGRRGTEPGAALEQICRWKSALICPTEAHRQAADQESRDAATVYAAYQRSLRAYNAVDFDDLLLGPVQIFRDHGEALRAWQGRLRYLLVDEYQDTNSAQYELVKLLVGDRGALTVVGDDDQSIYAWRGARPENLALLARDYPQLKLIKLEQNYRSTGVILKAANRLIGNNPHVFDKRLWSALGHGERIRVQIARDEDHEADRVAAQILHRRLLHQTPFRDFAILYRGNHQARPFERALREQGVPYHVSGGASFFSYAEVKDVMAYLRLLVNADDDSAFLRVVNTPRREIGAATLERLAAYAGERAISLFNACFELGIAERLGPRPAARLLEFAELLVGLGDRARRSEPLTAIQDLVAAIGYRNWLMDSARDEREARRRWDNVEELLGWLRRMAANHAGEPDLDDLVARLTLMDILERQDEDRAEDRVHLLTLHAAKGLEFPHVFMVGMEEDLLPHRSSIEADAIEEERRLAYVGITRAQRSLTFTFAERRRRQGSQVTPEPSRFLAELPGEDLDWEGRDGATPPRREDGRAHLAGLRRLLTEGG